MLPVASATFRQRVDDTTATRQPANHHHCPFAANVLRLVLLPPSLTVIHGRFRVVLRRWAGVQQCRHEGRHRALPIPVSHWRYKPVEIRTRMSDINELLRNRFTPNSRHHPQTRIGRPAADDSSDTLRAWMGDCHGHDGRWMFGFHRRWSSNRVAIVIFRYECGFIELTLPKLR